MQQRVQEAVVLWYVTIWVRRQINLRGMHMHEYLILVLQPSSQAILRDSEPFTRGTCASSWLFWALG